MGDTTPPLMNWISWSVPGHSRSRIENVMSRLIPLPMPRSVICSPSHITKMAPAVSVTTMMSREAKPGLGTAPGMDSVKSAKVYAWDSEMNTVMYRVHCVIFFRPSSSFCILPTEGMTPPASWKMIEAEMYGMMPRAKTVARDRPPPSVS